MRASSRDPRFLNCLLPTTRCPVPTRGAAVDGGRVGLAKTRNMTNEPTSGQVAGNAQTILQIKVKSEIRGGAAFDNVARFVRRPRTRPRNHETHETHEKGAINLAIIYQRSDQIMGLASRSK